MECPPIRAQAWLDDHGRELDGLAVADAVTLIESAGLEARVVSYPSGWMTQEQRRDRISVWLTETGEMGSIDAG
jgi:hypothetical protein